MVKFNEWKIANKMMYGYNLYLILVVYTLLHPSIGIVEGIDGVIHKTGCQVLSSAQAEIKTDGNEKCVYIRLKAGKHEYYETGI